MTEIGVTILTAKLAIGSQSRVHSELLNRCPQKLKIAPRPSLLRPASFNQSWRELQPPTNAGWIERRRRHQFLLPQNFLQHLLRRPATPSRDGAMVEAPLFAKLTS